MAVKSIIRRRVSKDKESQLLPLLLELRSKATGQPGYISGETLIENDDSQHMLVIGTWENIESWHSWENNRKRKEFEAMLEIYQEGPTEYEEYLLGVSHLE